MENNKKLLFQRFFHLTKQMNDLVEAITENLEDQQESLIEELEQQLALREEVIEAYVACQDSYSPTESELTSLKAWDGVIQRSLVRIHRAFSTQIRRVEQNKKAAFSYQQDFNQAFQTGTYYDKKK